MGRRRELTGLIETLTEVSDIDEANNEIGYNPIPPSSPLTNPKSILTSLFVSSVGTRRLLDEAALVPTTNRQNRQARRIMEDIMVGRID